MLERFWRYNYQPVLPIGRGGKLISASRAHLKLAKIGATEGTVLLKNDGALPFKKGERVVPFGRGTGDFIFGGGGSGVVNCKTKISLVDGLKKAARAGKIKLFTGTVDFYAEACRKEYADAGKKYGEGSQDFVEWNRRFVRKDYPVPAKLYEEAKKFGGTALYTITRYSSEAADRIGGEWGFALSAEEKAMLEKLGKDFEKVVVILNVCGMIETEFLAKSDAVNAVLYSQYGGAMAGESLAEILTGAAFPSGRLQDTLAKKLEDYPTTKSFLESDDYVNYTEDIYVGYRYFETFCPEKVVYPFGYGLGYTTFSHRLVSAKKEKHSVKLVVEVENTGSFAGKDVVQAYLSAPQGVLGKPARELADFFKTGVLEPGEKIQVALSFDLYSFASFDDLGKIEKSAQVLEKGVYKVYCGANVREAKEVFSFEQKKDHVIRVLHSYMTPVALEKRLLANGSFEALPTGQKKEPCRPTPARLHQKKPASLLTLEQAMKEDRLDAFMAQLSLEEIGFLLYGHPAVNPSFTGCIGALPERDHSKKIPFIPTSDGPAGVRFPKNHAPLDTTYFPSASVIAQSWNLKLCRKIGRAAALECKENNIGIWLAPALNLHRSPLCGRNFEYYSEDPMVSGEFAAACVKGVQGEHIVATIKHYCCNNKETNRKESDSRVSERALREVYLRGFEICVKKARPLAVMTSYNKVNGVRASANADAINGILRGEWGFDGVVMTDWRVYSSLTEEVIAGSDVKMPIMNNEFANDGSTKVDYDVTEELREGRIPRSLALRAVRHIFTMFSLLD